MSSEAVGMRLDFIPADQICIKQDEYNRLNLYNKATEEHYDDIEIKLVSPVSYKTRFLIIYHQGEEIGVIEDYLKLPPASRKTVQAVLKKVYFIPEIRKILGIKEEYQLINWKVETDHGEFEFTIQNRRDVVVWGQEVYIRDIDGNRYIIRNPKKLDPVSYKFLYAYI